MIDTEQTFHEVTKKEADLQLLDDHSTQVEIRPSIHDHDIAHDVNDDNEAGNLRFHPREEPYPLGPPSV